MNFFCYLRLAVFHYMHTHKLFHNIYIGRTFNRIYGVFLVKKSRSDAGKRCNPH